jgi:hypothetical protein
MSQRKAVFTWPRYKRIVQINMAGEEIISIELIDADCIVPDSAACQRYYISQSHIDRMTIAGEAPELIRTGINQKGRFASSWYRWELTRIVRPPALVKPAVPLPAPVAPEAPRRKPGRPRKIPALQPAVSPE